MKFLHSITAFIFIQDEPVPVDIIFIPGGGYPQIAERAAELYREGYSRLILPSGKYSILSDHFVGPADKSERYNQAYRTEWDFLADVLRQNGVLDQHILREEQASYTYENAIYSRQVTDRQGLVIDKAMICCQAYHARRCLMYYELLYPETKFYVCPAETRGITRENWFLSEEKADWVLGEVTRCGEQFTQIIRENIKLLRDDGE